MGEEPLLPGYRKSQTFYCLNCPEAPKPTSSSPAGRSTSLTLLKPRPRAHGPACSEGPHGSWGGGGVPHGQPCSCVEPGEAGWVLSHVARRDSKKDQILGHIGHPRSPILVMQAGRGWAVSGKVGMTSLLILSPKSPASPSQGARLRPWAWPPLLILLYYGQGVAAAGPLLAALALGTVWSAMTPLQRREWLRELRGLSPLLSQDR